MAERPVTPIPEQLDTLAAEAQDISGGLGGRAREPGRAVIGAYAAWGAGTAWPCAHRGSARSAEGTSFAGMNETFTNVAGDEALLRRVVDCWASLWGARSIFYRGDRDLTEEPSIAVVVQEMVPSERSGVMFTVDPSTGETGHLVIEAAFGQGEVVVSGQVEPDTYVVDKAGRTPATRARPGGDSELQDRARSRR